MRIGVYNQITPVYGTQSVKKSYNSDKPGAVSAKDQISFSGIGKDMQTAKNALSAVADVREDKVNALRESIANGTYDVSAESFAEKILSAFEARAI